MGTEVVAAEDGSLATILGASPGASTAVSIIIEIIQRCFHELFCSEKCEAKLRQLLPSYEIDYNNSLINIEKTRIRNNHILGLLD